MNTRYMIFAAIGLLSGTAAFAEPQCTMPQDTAAVAKTMRALVDAGHSFSRMEFTKSKCYELRGTDKEGRKFEIYVNPADGSATKSDNKRT
ncbi:MAG TPA: PepSY domain-containing protein [Aromatoleum sp.]|uniref:PepSY domain-containing protein n=1 Tax=Aromatoleum sp. TaxID=2307007 RepID=UPI002B465E7A|nr:PepSY domain-containing protein [Aromatoleum sp.]HJV28831.1 PepSY domain-containing protein [Aromatoleum sp.]